MGRAFCYFLSLSLDSCLFPFLARFLILRFRCAGIRGEGGIFLRTRGFQEVRRSIVFRKVFRSSATMMSPVDPPHANFLVLDFYPQSGLSFFCEGRRDSHAHWGSISDNMEKEITYFLD